MRRIKIKSKYNNDESFDYRSVPKHFLSVTDGSLEQLRKYCLRTSEFENNGDWEPSALESMLRGVLGRFDQAHARLEGDYSSRKSNLQNAYISGVAEVEEMLLTLESDIAEHNILFSDYAEAYEKFTGKKIGVNLKYDDSKLTEMKNRFDKLSKEF